MSNNVWFDELPDDAQNGQFDTGMTHAEAMRRAEKWWNERRATIPRLLDRERRVETRSGPGAPTVRLVTDEAVTGSGILAGDPWDDLDDVERQKIAVVWHHVQIRLPLAEAVDNRH